MYQVARTFLQNGKSASSSAWAPAWSARRRCSSAAHGPRGTQPPPPIALRLDVTDEHGRSQRDDPCWMELPLRDRLEALTQRGHTLQRAPRISDQVVSDRRGALTVRLIVAVTRRDQ